MKAILLVAGYATRLFPLTQNFPKALLSVGGKPLLSHIVDEMRQIPQIDQIHVVSNNRFYPHFVQWAQTQQDDAIFVHDDGTTGDDNKRGAIGDIAFVLNKTGMDDDCMIVAGDNLLLVDYRSLYAQFLVHERAPLLLGKHLDEGEDLTRYAVAVVDTQGRVTTLVEKPAVPPSDIGIFAFYIYPASVMQRIGEYLAQGGSPDAPGHFPVWLQTHSPIYAYITEKPCYDIGTHESLAQVRALYGE